MSLVEVDLGERSYGVAVGPGLLDELAELVEPPPHARTAAVVTNATVDALYGASVRAGLNAAGLTTSTVLVPDGEAAKSLDVLATLYHRFAAIPLRRDDLVVALGGGVVGDLAGFAAATWHRGVALVHLPTTLLAQVDSAVGGKTGINLPEGKNLVGAFHQPRTVVADTATLASLPVRERRAGLGEVAKYGFIADPQVLELLERRPAAAVAGDPELLTDVVRRGVAVKARIVGADERESGERHLLNYGHTAGHAIEAVTGYETYRHGEAVGLGMIVAARLSELSGLAEPGLAERTVALLAGLGLPTGGVPLDPARVWEHLERDKKARSQPAGQGSGGGVRFVLCERPGHARLEHPTRTHVEAALRLIA